jgi:uncharacterized membrane protein (DUF2068 family)
LADAFAENSCGARHAADAVHGLRIGAVVLGVPALVLFVSFWGLWKSKPWGWWLALAVDVIVLAVFAYGTFDANSIEWDEVGITLCLLVLLVFLLLPKVRKFYWTGPVPQVEVSS